MKLTSFIAKILLLTLAVFASTVTFALESDRNQPIRIQSNSAERNEQSGITVYRGAVRMKQGSLQIRADEVIIHSRGRNISRIVAKGHPAQYQQKPSAEEGPVTAAANTIKFQINENTLYLEENAFLDQDGATMKGDRIVYDINESQANAEGSQIEVVIPPQTPPEPEATNQ